MFLKFHGSTRLQFVIKTSFRIIENVIEFPGKFFQVSLSIPYEDMLAMLLEIIGRIPYITILNLC